MRKKLPRPISRTSRNPSVVTRPVVAPLRSTSALIPMVVPWITSRQSASRTPAWSTQRRTPAKSSRGVLSALPLTTEPVASSSATRSVKVPPMSTPIRRLTRALRLVVELEGERPVRHRGAGAQRRRDERRLGDFFPRGACLLRVPRVDIEAIRALRRAGHRERDQLAILARNLTVVTPDDLVELDEALELRRRELLELSDDFQVVRVVIVAHAVPPLRPGFDDALRIRCRSLRPGFDDATPARR